MNEEKRSSCSPYLLKERRELADACRQICKAHGEAAPPCGACGLADVCRHKPTAELVLLPQAKRAPTGTVNRPVAA